MTGANDSGRSHGIVDHAEGIVRCRRCDKMATSEEKLQNGTVCNPDYDPADQGVGE